MDRAASADWPPVITSALAPLTIGARADGSRAFKGRLDNIRIHTAPDTLPPDRWGPGAADLADLENAAAVTSASRSSIHLESAGIRAAADPRPSRVLEEDVLAPVAALK